MKRLFMTFVVGALLVVFLGFLYFSVTIYPWVKTPKVDHAVLKEKLAQCKSLTNRWASMPENDLKDFDTILVSFGNAAKNAHLDLLPKDPCSNRIKQGREEFLAVKGEMEKLFDQLDKPLADGFLIKAEQAESIDESTQEHRHQTEILLLTQAMIVDALADMDAGDDDAAMRQLTRLLGMMQGFYESPVLLNIMMAAAKDEQIDAAILYCLPKLSDKNLALLNGHLQTRLDAVEAFIRSLQGEIIFAMNVVDGVMKTGAIEGPALPVKMFRTPAFVMKRIFKRERLVYLQYMFERLSLYEQWLAKRKGNPGLRPPEGIWDPMHRPRSLLIEMICVDYGRMLGRVMKTQAYNDAVLKAVQMEIQRRAGGDEAIKFPFEETIDEGRKIVVDQDKGCLIGSPGAGMRIR